MTSNKGNFSILELLCYLEAEGFDVRVSQRFTGCTISHSVAGKTERLANLKYSSETRTFWLEFYTKTAHSTRLESACVKYCVDRDLPYFVQTVHNT